MFNFVYFCDIAFGQGTRDLTFPAALASNRSATQHSAVLRSPTIAYLKVLSAPLCLCGESEFSCSYSLRAHVWPQRLGNRHAAVSLLIIFQDRQPGPADGQPAAIEGVHKLRFFRALRPVTDIRPPRLKRLKIRAGRNLAENLL